MSDNDRQVSAEAGAASTGTDWLQLRGMNKHFDISIYGTFSATIHLQRKRPDDADAAARDIESYSVGAELLGEMHGKWDVRLRIKAGNYTSGTASLELRAI